jgi:hypothetical protein
MALLTAARAGDTALQFTREGHYHQFVLEVFLYDWLAAPDG